MTSSYDWEVRVKTENLHINALLGTIFSSSFPTYLMRPSHYLFLMDKIAAGLGLVQDDNPLFL